MIIEFFGPAAAGKTTFAHALCKRLNERAHHANVVLSYPLNRSETDIADGEDAGTRGGIRRIRVGFRSRQHEAVFVEFDHVGEPIRAQASAHVAQKHFRVALLRTRISEPATAQTAVDYDAASAMEQR